MNRLRELVTLQVLALEGPKKHVAIAELEQGLVITVSGQIGAPVLAKALADPAPHNLAEMAGFKLAETHVNGTLVVDKDVQALQINRVGIVELKQGLAIMGDGQIGAPVLAKVLVDLVPHNLAETVEHKLVTAHVDGIPANRVQDLQGRRVVTVELKQELAIMGDGQIGELALVKALVVLAQPVLVETAESKIVAVHANGMFAMDKNVQAFQVRRVVTVELKQGPAIMGDGQIGELALVKALVDLVLPKPATEELEPAVTHVNGGLA